MINETDSLYNSWVYPTFTRRHTFHKKTYLGCCARQRHNSISGRRWLRCFTGYIHLGSRILTQTETSGIAIWQYWLCCIRRCTFRDQSLREVRTLSWSYFALVCCININMNTMVHTEYTATSWDFSSSSEKIPGKLYCSLARIPFTHVSAGRKSESEICLPRMQTKMTSWPTWQANSTHNGPVRRVVRLHWCIWHVIASMPTLSLMSQLSSLWVNYNNYNSNFCSNCIMCSEWNGTFKCVSVWFE